MNQPNEDVEAKREALYASLLRYWPETGSLRERALDATVAAALLGSSAKDPYRIGRVQQNIRPATLRSLRPEIVRAAVKRLVAAGEARETTVAKRYAYYLDAGTAEALTSRAADGQSLLDRAADRAFRDTDHFISKADARQLFRRFVSECFATFGRRIAKTVTGHESANALPMLGQAVAAAENACANSGCSGNALASVRTRCLEFLRSTHPEDASLRMYLTQSYYVAELVGVDSGGFSPIADEAFRGTVFYLDTNVVIPRLLGTPEGPLFDELVRICARLGIELRITRATVNEARRVAADRQAQLEAVCSKIPEELTELSDDNFLRQFVERRRSDESLTVSVFLEPFDRIVEVLQGVVLDDRVVNDVLASTEVYARERKAIDDAARKAQAHGKSGARLEHDLMLHVLALREREQGRFTWLLTCDRAMITASEELRDGAAAPSCFLFKGFLQSISPFVADSDSVVLSQYFSAAIEEDVCAPLSASLFDIRELALIAQYHEDVLATPPADLVIAFERIKREVLKGAPYKRGSLGLVALELKKHLASNVDERLAAVLTQQRAEADRAEIAERELRNSGASFAELQRAKDAADQEAARQAELAAQFKADASRERQRNRLLVAALAIGASFLMPHVSRAAARTTTSAVGCNGIAVRMAEAADITAAVGAFLLAARWLRGSSQTPAVRSAILIGYATLAVLNTSVLARAPWEKISAVMTVVAFVTIWALERRRVSDPSKNE